MARPLRVEYPGAIYHITSRGNSRALVFTDDGDRSAFLEILANVNRRFKTYCHAYCLMDNHYHLLVETVNGNLSKAMKHLNGVYTQTFNRLHKRTGHVFQGRYKAILVARDSHLLEASRYIVMNPVRAGMLNAPEEWRWSSYRATAGLAGAEKCLTTSWLLSQFGNEPLDAILKYRKFIADAPDGHFSEKVVSGIAFGSSDFASLCRRQGRVGDNVDEFPREQRYAGRPKIASIMGEPRSRAENILKAVVDHGYTQKAVADELGIHYSGVSRILSRQMARFKT